MRDRMTDMDEAKQKLVELIDQALSQSEQMLQQSPAQTEHLQTLIAELQRIKATALSDQLQPSEGTLTLGLSRGLADWIDPLNSPLMETVGAVELHYQQHF